MVSIHPTGLNTPLNILFVTDAAEQYQQIQDLLSSSRYLSYVVEWSANCDEALDRLLHGEYDAALIDHTIGECSGLTLIRDTLEKGCKAPLIFLTDNADHEIDIEVMKAGAADYLEKSEIRSSSLERSIRYSIERTKAIANLRESEERYRDLFENSTDLIQSVDLDGNYLYVNHAWRQTLGYTEDEIQSLNMLNIIHPAYVEHCMTILQQVLIGRETQNIQTVFLAKDGREIIVEGNINGKHDGGAKPVTRGIFRDITKRRHTEEALKTSEQRLRMVIQHLPVFLFTVDRDGTFHFGDGKMSAIPGFAADMLEGKHVESLLITLSDQPLDDIQRINLDKAFNGQPGHFILPISDRSFEVFYAPMHDPEGEFIGIIGVSTDVTTLKQAETAERTQRRLAEALYGTAAALNSTLNFEEILDRILINIGKVIPHETATIIMIEDGFGHTTRSYTDQQGASAENGDKISIKDVPNLRTMVETRQPIIVPDTHKQSEWVDIPEARWMRSYAGIPIQSDGKVIGFLNLGSSTAGFFSNDMTHYLQVFSHQIAAAIQNARFYEQGQELAALNERQRLARDLHDAVSQTLFSASLIAESLPRIAKNLPDTVRSGLKELHLLNRRALAEMRSLLLELRPKALTDTSLEELLRQLAETFISRQRIEMDMQIAENLNVSEDVKIALYRIVQEALNNVTKHARATEVTFYLIETPEGLQLQIGDNGSGFDVRDTLPDNLGLSIMKERAKSVSAAFQLHSIVGQGTTVTVTLSPNKAQV
jgi:PAS domain S-box-containing protein